jgi:Fe-S-cluster containining protein
MAYSHNADAKLLIDSPAYWNEETLRKNWMDYLESSISSGEITIPIKRFQRQIESTTDYLETMRSWNQMDGSARLNAWKRLLEAFEKLAQEALPACVQCGDCCRKGSPTLHLEDLEILRQGSIPWSQLIALRQDEAAYSPFDEKPFLVSSEYIKVREKPGSNTCAFLDDHTNQCTIYRDRPVQCRAQTCWDAAPAKQLSSLPYLTRNDIFGEVELLSDIIAEHDLRCSFKRLSEAFSSLTESEDSTVNRILEQLAYEDHYRHFFKERLSIPEDTLDLVFGRSFVELVPLFGFQVVTDPDGSRCLIPEMPLEPKK